MKATGRMITREQQLSRNDMYKRGSKDRLQLHLRTSDGKHTGRAGDVSLSEAELLERVGRRRAGQANSGNSLFDFLGELQRALNHEGFVARFYASRVSNSNDKWQGEDNPPFTEYEYTRISDERIIAIFQHCFKRTFSDEETQLLIYVAHEELISRGYSTMFGGGSGKPNGGTNDFRPETFNAKIGKTLEVMASQPEMDWDDVAQSLDLEIESNMRFVKAC